MNVGRQSDDLARMVRGEAGFTLVEIMVAGAIGAFILASVLTTYVFSMKGLRAIANYDEIHSDGRHAVDVFAQDMRGVNSVTSFSASSLTVTIPTSFSSSGSVTSTKTVRYYLNSAALYRTDSSTGNTDMLATNICQLTFSLYDKLGNGTAVPSSAKGVQVDIKLRKYVLSIIQSEDFLSARYDMRNVP
jgi:Tfp pilus assembly protein PilW